jgi:hypothetical protein
VGLACAALVASAASTYAHHSIAGIYDDNRRVTIEGVVKMFEFINPHPFLVMEVQDDRGRLERWKLEMDNRWELAELGFATETLRPGDRIVVSGILARRLPHSVYVRRLERPADGFSYQHHP